MATILVVDDNADSSRLLVALLRRVGYSTLFAESGPEALAKLDTIVPDLVILDLMMPGMSGFDVLERIRSEPRTAELPVVMFSALDDAATESAAKQRGATDYWVKSQLDFRSIRDNIERHLNA